MPALIQDVDVPKNPCVPSPCGPFSECRDFGGASSCACMPSYIGAPPSCRPECTINSECSSNMACINQKCKDPCPGSCGINARCIVQMNTPICLCNDNYVGDAFVECKLQGICALSFGRKLIQHTSFVSNSVTIISEIIQDDKDPCNPSPCGQNAICRNGECSCLPDYNGDPYFECRPECILSSDCNQDKACVRNKCVNPCNGVCAQNAICEVINHIPMCRCPEQMSGNAFVMCSPVQGTIKTNQPSNKKSFSSLKSSRL